MLLAPYAEAPEVAGTLKTRNIMENDNLTPGTLPDGGSAGPAGGEGAASASTVSIKEVLSKHLGKEFPDDETALKSVKDTFDYVGTLGKEKTDLQKKVAELSPTGNPNDALKVVEDLKRQIRERDFYMDNPEYKEVKNLIGKFGDDPAVVVASEDFKNLYAKLQPTKNDPGSKSILQTNARIAADTGSEYQKDFAQAEKTGNWNEFMRKHKGVKFGE